MPTKENFYTMIDMRKLKWAELAIIKNIPNKVLSWIIDDKSLTAKLKQKYPDFAVNVIRQTKKLPSPSEAKILGSKEECVVREVELIGDTKVVVFARSVILITPDTKDLLKIGSKPLGEVLFNDKNIKRGSLQVVNTDNIWGRRSIFTIGTTKILVSEFFLEELYA